jgi:DNA modification methylase
MVDKGELSASHAVVLNEKKLVEKFSEDQLKRLAKLAQAVSVDALRKGINELLEFEPELFNVWNFRVCNPLFGKEGYPGRMPGQVVMNLLHYYTEPGELVVDPFAGSGTTLDVCYFMDRKCLAFDLNPVRPDIKQNDVTTGIPLDSESADFVLLDPPYSIMKKGEYTEHPNDLSNMNLNDYFQAIRKVFAESKRILKRGKCCAFISSSLKLNGKFVDIAYESRRIAEEEGFAPIERIIVPYGGNEASASDWVKIAKEKKLLLRGYRDLIILRK